jgi:hypothetical protein
MRVIGEKYKIKLSDFTAGIRRLAITVLVSGYITISVLGLSFLIVAYKHDLQVACY